MVLLSEPLCVHSFGFSRSLHFNLVREYKGEFVRCHSGMFLILLHVEKKRKKKDKRKRNQKQADKMVKENILVPIARDPCLYKDLFSLGNT